MFSTNTKLVETAEGGGEGDGDAALGRLSEAQIKKGQAVLAELRKVLTMKNSAKKKKLLGELSNDFYSLIPSVSGRQRPPALDNDQIVTEKEGLLEFWLRMGFEDLGDEMVRFVFLLFSFFIFFLLFRTIHLF